MSDVSSIPDEKLLERAVKAALNPHILGKQMRWQGVMWTFGLGSTYAQQLCRRFGLDPDEKVRK